jgi:hypothetical protein
MWLYIGLNYIWNEIERHEDVRLLVAAAFARPVLVAKLRSNPPAKRAVVRAYLARRVRAQGRRRESRSEPQRDR